MLDLEDGRGGDGELTRSDFGGYECSPAIDDTTVLVIVTWIENAAGHLGAGADLLPVPRRRAGRSRPTRTRTPRRIRGSQTRSWSGPTTSSAASTSDMSSAVRRRLRLRADDERLGHGAPDLGRPDRLVPVGSSTLIGNIRTFRLNPDMTVRDRVVALAAGCVPDGPGDRRRSPGLERRAERERRPLSSTISPRARSGRSSSQPGSRCRPRSTASSWPSPTPGAGRTRSTSPPSRTRPRSPAWSPSRTGRGRRAT